MAVTFLYKDLVNHKGIKTWNQSYYGFLITVDKKVIPTQCIKVENDLYFMNDFMGNCEIPMMETFRSKYCFKLNDHIESFVSLDTTSNHNGNEGWTTNVLPDVNYYVNSSIISIAFLYDNKLKSYKSFMIRKGKFYHDDLILGVDEIAKSGKYDVSKSMFPINRGKIVSSCILYFDSNDLVVYYKGVSSSHAVIDFKNGEERLTNHLSPVSSRSGYVIITSLPLNLNQLNIPLSEYSQFQTVYNSIVRQEGRLRNSSCADFIKTYDRNFSYFLDLEYVYGNGNSEELIHEWIDFISDFLPPTLKIVGNTTSAELKTGTYFPARRYVEVSVSSERINHSFENYVYLILIRYLQGGRTGFIPRIALDIYKELKDKVEISKWQAVLLAHYVPDLYEGYALGSQPSFNLDFQRFLSNTSDNSVNKHFTNKSIGVNMSMFEKRQYLEIYNKIKKHYDNL